MDCVKVAACRTVARLRLAVSNGSQGCNPVHSTLIAAAIAILFLSACSDKPIVTAVDTLCVSTSRPAITEAQRAAFKADQALWEPLVDWLASFIKVRDGACLKPKEGP